MPRPIIRRLKPEEEEVLCRHEELAVAVAGAGAIRYQQVEGP